MEIKLNFVNRSNVPDTDHVVIFQAGNGAPNQQVAWTVIQHCGPGWHHPFVYPMQTAISVTDNWGNQSPLMEVNDGQVYQVVDSPSGHVLEPVEDANSRASFEVINQLPDGSIVVNVYKDKRLFCQKTTVYPKTVVSFDIVPKIFIGTFKGLEEGQPMPAETELSTIAEISLMGLFSADIVMTGGGDAPVIFELANINA